MAKTLSVTLAHSLGAVEARRRLNSAIESLRQQYASQISQADIVWQGDHADMKVGALGQTISARVDVGEDQLHIEVDLPWLLQKLAEPVQAFLTRRGDDMLRIGKS